MIESASPEMHHEGGDAADYQPSGGGFGKARRNSSLRLLFAPRPCAAESVRHSVTGPHFGPPGIAFVSAGHVIVAAVVTEARSGRDEQECSDCEDAHRREE